jgi:hypothetical protein
LFLIGKRRVVTVKKYFQEVFVRAGGNVRRYGVRAVPIGRTGDTRTSRAIIGVRVWTATE